MLNVVSGDAAAIGETLTASPVVRKIGFTGSTRVGKLLLRQSAETVKRVSMELGGNAPFVVFADADVAAAADALVASGLRNAGQTCVCANRVLVHVRRSARPASARHMRVVRQLSKNLKFRDRASALQSTEASCSQMHLSPPAACRCFGYGRTPPCCVFETVSSAPGRTRVLTPPVVELCATRPLLLCVPPPACICLVAHRCLCLWHDAMCSVSMLPSPVFIGVSYATAGCHVHDARGRRLNSQCRSRQYLYSMGQIQCLAAPHTPLVAAAGVASGRLHTAFCSRLR